VRAYARASEQAKPARPPSAQRCMLGVHLRARERARVRTCSSVPPLDPLTTTRPGPRRIMPVAMHTGLRFALREGGKTVGAGVVSTVME